MLCQQNSGADLQKSAPLFVVGNPCRRLPKPGRRYAGVLPKKCCFYPFSSPESTPPSISDPTLVLRGAGGD